MLAYFAACYILTWTAWLAAAGIQDNTQRTLLILLGTFMPGIVALGLSAMSRGRSGVKALLLRLFLWQVPWRWYLFAATYIAVIKLMVAVFHRATTGAWPTFGLEPWYLLLAATLASTFLGGQVGEELGWRGYALPRLAARFGLGGASILLGLLWACWHLPLFVVLGGDTLGQSFPLYLLQVTALSVAMAWLYAHTQGSLLLVMLMHAAVNNIKDIVPSAEPFATDPWVLSQSPVAWMTVAVLWVCATYFLVQMRRDPKLTQDVLKTIAT